MQLRPAIFAGLALVVAVALGSCDGDDEGEAPVFGTDGIALDPANVAFVGACDGKTPDHVVRIDNFGYSPLSLNVKVGETVAWVNTEECGDTVQEDLAIPLAGCDTHHQVVTFPEILGGENVSSGPICSPNRGTQPTSGLPGLVPIDSESCADAGESNVFCHTFAEPGTQHYTCFTNPAHSLLLNGFLTVVD